jgi:hypothetical protein
MRRRRRKRVNDTLAALNVDIGDLREAHARGNIATQFNDWCGINQKRTTTNETTRITRPTVKAAFPNFESICSTPPPEE